jgi:hypothetical protein
MTPREREQAGESRADRLWPLPQSLFGYAEGPTPLGFP